MELTLEQQQLLELAKRVPAQDIPAAKRALEALLDPFEVSLLSADYDDEPVTADDIAAMEEAEAAYKRGETIPHEEIRREFGLN